MDTAMDNEIPLLRALRECGAKDEEFGDEPPQTHGARWRRAIGEHEEKLREDYKTLITSALHKFVETWNRDTSKPELTFTIDWTVADRRDDEKVRRLLTNEFSKLRLFCFITVQRTCWSKTAYFEVMPW